MKKRQLFIILGVFLAALLVVVLVGPFFVPVPPLQGVTSPKELSDPDSQFIEINDLDVHVKRMGQGEAVFVLLHGFGASLYSWHSVMEPFSQYGTTIAYDRVAFGLTERPMEWLDQNPYSSQAAVDTLVGLLDHYGVEKAILVGNSAGGTVSMEFYLQHSERVEALILVAPAVYVGGRPPSWLRPILRTPQMNRLGPLVVRKIQSRGLQLIEMAWHDPTQLDSETIELYTRPLRVENWDKALWYFTITSEPSNVAERLEEFTLPVLVITGDDDRIVPADTSIRVADELPEARLVMLENSGHVPHEETPIAFMQAVEEFVSNLKP